MRSSPVPGHPVVSLRSLLPQPPAARLDRRPAPPTAADARRADRPPLRLTDEAGNRTAVLLDLAEYRRLADAAEELADVRAFDAAKASGEDRLPLDEAFAEVDRRRAGAAA